MCVNYIKALFTLRSIFGTARIKLVPVPLFWFLDYTHLAKPHLHYAQFLVPYHFLVLGLPICTTFWFLDYLNR
jgi:hypothetical protein